MNIKCNTHAKENFTGYNVASLTRYFYNLQAIDYLRYPQHNYEQAAFNREIGTAPLWSISLGLLASKLGAAQPTQSWSRVGIKGTDKREVSVHRFHH